MDIWSRIFFEKFRITFKVCVHSIKGGGGQPNVDRRGQGEKGGGGGESKITENVRISFMDGPCWYIKF